MRSSGSLFGGVVLVLLLSTLAVGWYHRSQIGDKRFTPEMMKRFGGSMLQAALLVFFITHVSEYLSIAGRMQTLELVFWLWLCCIVPVLLGRWMGGEKVRLLAFDAGFFALILCVLAWLL